jgi:hypothetical protein
MKILTGSAEVPVIYTAHHASPEFGEFSKRTALSAQQRLRFSDYGTSETVATNGIATLIATRSRALGDLNRDPSDPGLFPDQDFSKPQRHNIWLPGQELTEDEKIACKAVHYNPFHDKILDLLRDTDGQAFVVAWDNTANYTIGKNVEGSDIRMPSFILSNQGKEGQAKGLEGETTTCDPDFLIILGEYMSETLAEAGLPNDIHLNLVYKGGYICKRYSSSRNADELEELGISSPTQSLQIEYNTAITHNQETLQKIPGQATLLQKAFSKAMLLTTARYKKLSGS